ncbi:MAG: fimbrillin family protein [Prevotella sp.]|nr:fimbrillin family protein [Prevotella sp.]
MKLSKLPVTRLLLFTVLASLFISQTACTDEEGDSHASQELVLKVSMEGTRATPGGTWRVGDFIAVKIGTTVKKYVIKSLTGEATGADAANTFYWDELGTSSVTVTAWTFGGKYTETLSNTLSVATDQSSDANFVGSDFLYAPATTITRNASAVLNFYHQMSRFNINVKTDATATIEKVILGGGEWQIMPYVEGTYSLPDPLDQNSDPNYGTFVIDYDNHQAAEMIPHKEETKSGFEASYSAIMIPTAYESFFFFIITDDGTVYKTPYETYIFDPGAEITYNVTIKNKQLIVAPANWPVGVEVWQTPSAAAPCDLTTTFNSGDKIGVFVVDPSNYDEVVCANIPYVYDGTAWNQADASKRVSFSDKFRYFAYYPYQESNNNNVYSWYDDAEHFFEPIIGSWTPKTDQSTLQDFNASDLMIAKGTVCADATVTFTLEHQMHLVRLSYYNWENQANYEDVSFIGNSYFYDEGNADNTYPIPYNNGNYLYYIAKPGTTFSFWCFGNAINTYEQYSVNVSENKGSVTDYTIHPSY